MTFDERYTEFLNALEDIEAEHDELTDTDVRERMHEAINWYFVWGHPMDGDFPQRYAMFSQEGDAWVAKAVRAFVEDACKIAADLKPGAERHAALENPNIESKAGNSYDWFLGSSDAPVPLQRPAKDSLYGHDND